MLIKKPEKESPLCRRDVDERIIYRFILRKSGGKSWTGESQVAGS
jgi:hypothetical protein